MADPAGEPGADAGDGSGDRRGGGAHVPADLPARGAGAVNAPAEAGTRARTAAAAAGDVAGALAAARARGDARTLIARLEAELGLDAPGFLAALSAYADIAAISLADMERCRPAFELLPFAEAQARELLLLDDGARLLAVTADPFNLTRRAWLEERAGRALAWRLAHATEIGAWLARHERDLRAMDGLESLAAGARADDDAEDLSLAAISAQASPVVKLVDSTLYDALAAGASDIHLESVADGMHIKYRLDGVLSQVGAAAGHDLAEQVVSRIKVMAELDIAERRVPQDGRFKVRKGGREIDFRVSVMPSVFGEDAVLRILDKQALADANRGITLGSLGFSGSDHQAIRALAAAPYGMLLVTGPTGSGKTTTLY
ncbi:MAG: Flp pilus assembly complex ATPase component TadA, partial [Burkholderiales bacterium]|nr:Flp pilus assembly complex ATPase component TadA [Burkholderiales bacterium]